MTQIKILNGRFAVSTAPPSEGDLRALAEDGYKAVVNLRCQDEADQPLAPDREGEVVASLGLEYCHLPVAGGTISDELVDEFRASQYLVSNQEFLAFVEAGGYQEDRLWSEEGCAWRQFAKARHPTFWRWQNGWHLRLMTEEVEMPWDWPVEVNYHEAKAFCEWKREETGIKEVDNDPANANLHLDHGASSCPASATSTRKAKRCNPMPTTKATGC